MRMLRRCYVRPALAAAARPFSAAPGVDELASSATSSALSAGASAGSSSSKERNGGNTLGKQLLSLVYAKRSAVVTIRQWKEKGNQVRKYELNRIVRELRKLKRFKHALEVRSFSLSELCSPCLFRTFVFPSLRVEISRVFDIWVERLPKLPVDMSCVKGRWVHCPEKWMSAAATNSYLDLNSRLRAVVMC